MALRRCALLLLVVLVAATAMAAEAKILGNRTACPASTVQCGLFQNGKNFLTCRRCGKEYPDRAPGLQCDWNTGKCVGNKNQEGRKCDPKNKKDVCAPGLSCQYMARSAGKLYRCAYTKCPPGLCGAYKIKYTNICGKTMDCPVKC